MFVAELKKQHGVRAGAPAALIEMARKNPAAASVDAARSAEPGGAGAGAAAAGRMTRYELVCVLCTRAEQLSVGAASTLPPAAEDESPLQTAMRELLERRMPLLLRRDMPDGTFLDVSANDMVLPTRELRHLSAVRLP